MSEINLSDIKEVCDSPKLRIEEVPLRKGELRGIDKDPTMLWIN